MAMKRIIQTDSKWFRDRLADKRMSAAQLARLIHLSPGTLSRKLDGYVKITMREAADIAAILGTPVLEIIHRAGISTPVDATNLIRIAGTVEAGGIVSHGPGSGPRRTERLSSTDKTHIALRIDDPGSPLNGSIVYYSPTVRLEPDTVGRLAIVQEPGKKGVQRFGILQHGLARGTWRLHQLHIDPVGVEVPVEWAAAVRGVRV